MARRKSGTTRFAGFPLQVLRHRNYARLSFSARALLTELRLQYNGYNNGSLRATWSMLEPRGWKSKETLNYGLQELLHYGFIERTRRGKRCGGTHYPSLYAITWESVHGNDADSVAARLVPSNAWQVDCESWRRPTRKNPRTVAVLAKNGIRTCPSTFRELSKKRA